MSCVNKWFDAAQVLHDVSFRADAGEFVVLLGPSGCGKSTSLRLVAGLEDAQTGDVLIGGARVNGVPAAERGISMVFRSYALFPHLTVAENIVFGLRVRRVARAERARRLERAAELLGLSGLLDRRTGQLSGGQRQRVALGRALVSGASVVLMDEPLSNLDAKLRQQMRLELREIQRALGLTVIYVTHDQVEAMTMADKVVVMREGRIDQIAPPARPIRTPRAGGGRPLHRRPADGAAARQLRRRAPHGEVRIDGTAARLHSAAALPARLLLGVRAEDIVADPAGAGPGALGLPARVSTVELLGGDVLARLEIGPAAGTLTARFPVHLPVAPGDRLTLGLPVDRLHLFDADTGLRIDDVLLSAAPAAAVATRAGLG